MQTGSGTSMPRPESQKEEAMNKGANQKSKIVEKIQEEVAKSFKEKRDDSAGASRPEKLIYLRF
jgi:hypothetical protein